MTHRYLLRTVIFHQSVHLLQSAFVPLGDVHVQGVVAARLAVGPLSPLLESGHQTGPGLWHHMVDCETQTTGQGLCAPACDVIRLHARRHAHLHCYDRCNRMTAFGE